MGLIQMKEQIRMITVNFLYVSIEKFFCKYYTRPGLFFRARSYYCMDLELNLGIIKLSGKYNPSDNEKKAAWELYVELVTRITIIELDEGKGMLREALTSLYSLFNITREVLRKYGSSVAKVDKKSKISFGYLSVSILNHVIRPFLSNWHQELLDYEQKREHDVSTVKHEQLWEYNEEFRNELRTLQKTLKEYSEILEEIIGIPSVLTIND